MQAVGDEASKLPPRQRQLFSSQDFAEMSESRELHGVSKSCRIRGFGMRGRTWLCCEVGDFQIPHRQVS